MSDKAYFAHPSACIDEPCIIGAGTQIWHYCHVMSGAQIGGGVMLGQNVFVAGSARIGHRTRVQNNVSIYDGVELEEDVFLGPSCVLTNVPNPRAEIRRRGAYQATRIRRGATVGANATIVCGVVIGRHAFIAAGAVVTHDVLDYALIMGVPGRHVGWMGRHGERLVPDPESGQGHFRCLASALRYREVDGTLRCLDVDEDAPLPLQGPCGGTGHA